MSGLIILYIIVIVLVVLFLALNFGLAPHNPDKEKAGAFECGFSSWLGQNRKEFNAIFFLLGLAFLIFDLELLTIFPFAMSIYENGPYGLTCCFIFMIIVTAGFCFELGRNALSLDSRQSNEYFKDDKKRINSLIQALGVRDN